MILALLIGVAIGLALGALAVMFWPTKESRAWDAMVSAEPESTEEDPKPVELVEFPVAGKPRRVPWSVRKAAIESQHRTKRRQIEEW